MNEVKEKTGNLNIIQRLHKAICDFIAKVKNIFKGDKSAQDAAAQKAFGTDTATLERARDLLKQAYDKGVKEIESRKGEQTGEYTDLGNGVRYSVKETFDEQIDKWSAGEMRSDLDFRVCNTPNSLKKIGIEDMPIVMTQKVMKKITGGKHDLSLNEIKKIPQNLAEPIMVFKSATQNNAFVVLTEMNDMHGDAVVVALHVNKEYKHMKVNNIASVYGKKNIENFIGMQSEAGNLLYIDKNKSQQWSQSRGLRLPKLADTIIDNDSVSQKENNVNTQYMQNGENDVKSTRKFSVKTESENIENGDKITIEDVKAVQSIPRKSVNDFSADDIKKTERFARRYFKEMGTKSPFFRSWFGDWRENDTTKVRVAAEKGSQRGVTKNLDTGWNINVSGKVFNETGHKAIKNQRALQYLDYINSIVENAVLFVSHTIAGEKAKPLCRCEYGKRQRAYKDLCGGIKRCKQRRNNEKSLSAAEYRKSAIGSSEFRQYP